MLVMWLQKAQRHGVLRHVFASLGLKTTLDRQLLFPFHCPLSGLGRVGSMLGVWGRVRRLWFDRFPGQQGLGPGVCTQELHPRT